MSATVLDGAVIGAQSLIGAGSLVTKGMKIPPGSLVLGSPARVLRALTAEERTALRESAEKYIQVAAAHKARLPSS
jgi:carbonic anhydrase/acetyltransferase-like protein (isoleucine patch superfamily)